MSTKNDAILNMTISPAIEKVMKEELNLEIEMLQGRRRVLKDGRIKYKVVIKDKQKQELVRKYITMVFAHDSFSDKAKN